MISFYTCRNRERFFICYLVRTLTATQFDSSLNKHSCVMYTHLHIYNKIRRKSAAAGTIKRTERTKRPLET